MRVNHQERLESTSQEIVKNCWGKLLLRVTLDVFDAVAVKPRLENVCRPPWDKMYILPTPFISLIKC